MDPHCGLCYANERSIKDIADYFKSDYDFEVLSGGMWKGDNAKRGGESMYDFLLPSIIRINQFHNVEIAGSYIDLLKDSTYFLSSEWPSRAISSIKKMNEEKALVFSYKLMKQQFMHGKRYDIERTYIEVIEEMGLNRNEFLRLWKSEEIGKETLEMFNKAEKMSKGYPSLILQNEDGFKIIKEGIFSAGEAINKIENKRLVFKNISN